MTRSKRPYVPRPKRPVLTDAYQRIRKDYDIKAVTSYQERTYADCVSQPRWTITGPYVRPMLNGVSRIMVDWVVPRYKQRRANGEKFFNSLYKEVVTVQTDGNSEDFTAIPYACGNPALHAQWRIKDNNGGFQDHVPTEVAPNAAGHYLPRITSLVSDQEIERVKRVVSTAVLAKRGTADDDLWESLAEIRKTIEMLNRPLGNLDLLSKRLISSFNRSALSRELLSEVSSGYLMYRYGIMPLLKDIRTILSSLHKPGGKTQKTSRAKERLHAQRQDIYARSNGLLNVGISEMITDTVDIRGMSLDEGFVSFANNLGFSTKGLALLPLQLTSYSFVADWFVNLSDYIQSTIPAFGWNQLGSCLVTKRTQTSLYVPNGYTNLLPATYTVTSGPNGLIYVTKTTTVREALYPSSIEMQSDFKFDKFKRAADAAALIAGRFSRLGSLGSLHREKFGFKEKKAYETWADHMDSHTRNVR